MEVVRVFSKRVTSGGQGIGVSASTSVLPQETARVNIDILGISELKWTGMGEFNSDDTISTTVGKNSLEEME